MKEQQSNTSAFWLQLWEQLINNLLLCTSESLRLLLPNPPFLLCFYAHVAQCLIMTLTAGNRLPQHRSGDRKPTNQPTNKQTKQKVLLSCGNSDWRPSVSEALAPLCCLSPQVLLRAAAAWGCCGNPWTRWGAWGNAPPSPSSASSSPSSSSSTSTSRTATCW